MSTLGTYAWDVYKVKKEHTVLVCSLPNQRPLPYLVRVDTLPLRVALMGADVPHMYPLSPSTSPCANDSRVATGSGLKSSDRAMIAASAAWICDCDI